MNEIIFLIQEAPECGYTADALGHSVSVQAETEEEIRGKIQEVTESHFGAGRVAKIATGIEFAPQTKIVRRGGFSHTSMKFFGSTVRKRNQC